MNVITVGGLGFSFPFHAIIPGITYGLSWGLDIMIGFKRKFQSNHLPAINHKTRPYGSLSTNQQAISSILRSSSTPLIQTKLKIGAPNDHFEQEADQMADRVMNMDVMPDSPVLSSSATTAGPEIQRQPMEEEEELLQAKESPGKTPSLSAGNDTALNQLNSSGANLPASSREFFEPRFGQDFSHVKVHSDAKSQQLAASINAKAFTYGNNIVFGAGEYQPNSENGKRLLGHELTHVIQQSGR